MGSSQTISKELWSTFASMHKREEEEEEESLIKFILLFWWSAYWEKEKKELGIVGNISEEEHLIS